MVSAQLTAAEAAGRVWRVGFSPEPWAWSGWEWARRPVPRTVGDLHGNFRTIYAGSSLLACLLEVLAHFRKDARLSVELDEVVEDDEDKILHPTIAPGQVPREWLEVRTAAALKDARPRHLTQAVAAWLYEMTDFDGVTFASRHGDDLHLWAIFERPGDPPVTPNIQNVMVEELEHDSPEISKAFELFGLQWEND